MRRKAEESQGVLVLRLLLTLGLVGHKVLWEQLKSDDRGQVRPPPVPGLDKRLIKVAKAGALGGLLLQTLCLSLLPISRRPLPLRIIGTAMYLLGLAVAITGRLHLGKNWANLEDYQVLPEQRLVREGIYAYVRHPIYTGDLLLLIGLELALNSWLVLAALVPGLVVLRQTVAEEKLLSQRYGDYSEYRRRTKRYIPFVF